MQFIDAHTTHSASLVTLMRSIVRHRRLIVQMIGREVTGRYKGSLLGLAWSFFNPVFMLLVYTFVFSVVFKMRWAEGGEETKAQFAIVLFVGMIVHGLFSEVTNRAPGLILSNANYVKKVVFPLELLPIIAMGAALFHALVSFIVLVIAYIIANGFLHWTVIFVPLIAIPLVVFTVGIAWILASVGVFLRDVSQTIGVVTTVLLFLSPVFYPATALPAQIRPWLMLNPLTLPIEQARQAIVWGKIPDFMALMAYTVVACAIAWLGYAWFQKTRKGFADVL